MGVEAVGLRVAKIPMNKKTVQQAESWAKKSGSFMGSVDKKHMGSAIKDVSGIEDHSKIVAVCQCGRGGETALTQHPGRDCQRGIRAVIKGRWTLESTQVAGYGLLVYLSERRRGMSYRGGSLAAAHLRRYLWAPPTPELQDAVAAA